MIFDMAYIRDGKDFEKCILEFERRLELEKEKYIYQQHLIEREENKNDKMDTRH